MVAELVVKRSLEMLYESEDFKGVPQCQIYVACAQCGRGCPGLDWAGCPVLIRLARLSFAGFVAQVARMN